MNDLLTARLAVRTDKDRETEAKLRNGNRTSTPNTMWTT
jgi:hypothetical protein